MAGEVDVLVNNAGYGLKGAIEEVADEELFEQYNVNVFGPWRLCRAVLYDFAHGLMHLRHRLTHSWVVHPSMPHQNRCCCPPALAQKES